MVICSCCLLFEMVRKKQIRISRAIITTKMKFDKVSNPSQLAKDCNESGKTATIIKAIGSRNQAIEFLIDKVFFASSTTIIMNNIIAAIIISICRVFIFLFSLF